MSETASLLAEHRIVYESDGDYGEMSWVECSCGDEYPTTPPEADESDHRAHVAAIIDAHFAERERALVERHEVVYASPNGLEVVCACGSVLSIYGLTRTIASIFGQHITDSRRAALARPATEGEHG